MNFMISGKAEKEIKALSQANLGLMYKLGVATQKNYGEALGVV